jgi:acetyltransferase-like isoleucine patch superfamily enzyme
MLEGIRRYLLRLSGRLKRAGVSSISSSAFIAPRVQFIGVEHVEIGNNTTIGENTLITINDRSHKHIALSIGDNVYIGRDNFFTVGKFTSIGPYSTTGNGCAFISSDHIIDPNKPYMSTGATTDKVIRVGANVWMGFRVTVVGHVSIGHGSVIGANSVVVKDIPPFSVAVGNPARIIRRFNFTAGEWEKGETIHDTGFMDEAEYIAHLRKSGYKLPQAAVAASSAYGDL